VSVTGGASDDVRTLFVGRQAELALVAEALVAAREARPQLVVVEGEAGIGKTAFLRRCQSIADGFVVLQAAGEESEIGLDRGVISQLIARAPGVGSTSGSTFDDAASASNPFAVGAELLSLLGALQDGGPVLLVLDDAHWIDATSAAALLFALRRLHADRVCALIATRPGGDERSGPGWSRFLDDGERACRIRLAGLDEHEVRSLVGSLVATPLSRAAAERLRDHTDGHPLYIRALVDELPAQSLSSEHGPLPAPHSFAATVLARLATLSPAARDLAAAAAVAGPRCRADRALAAAGLDGTLTPLDEVLAAGVLVLVPGRLPTEIQFAHPLTRAAVYDDLSPSGRRDLNLALARLTDGPESLAYRVAASHGADDELAAELAEIGDDEVMAGRLTAGVDHLILASRVAADRELGERALLRAVEALGLAGDVPRARELREAVERCADTPRRSFALGCMIASQDGRLDESVQQLMAVTHRRDLADDPELAGPLTSSLAIVCAYAGRGPEAIEWARRALAEQSPSPAVALTARQGLALGLAQCGREREAVEALSSPSLSQANPPAFDVELVITRGAIKAQAGDLRGAVADLTAVIGWSRAGAASRGLPNAYASLADAEYRLGRWQRGAAHADLAVSLARDSDQVWELPFAHATASLFDVGRGEWPAAERHVQDAASAAQLAPLPLAVFYARSAAANLACARGEPRRTLELLAALWDELPAAVVPALRRRTHELEAEALLQAGRIGEAAELLDRSEPDSGGWWRLSGMLAHARGDLTRARDAFVRGQDAPELGDSPFAQGTFELAYGHFLRRTGRRGAAASRLRTARELLEPLGARPLLARCDVELSACGVRGADAVGTEDLGLTPREAAVAALVAAGRSNREAGAELYLSTKAIEYHLGNIFGKLGIHSRHELAARLPERELA
jgi:DNA-binding CsgD family transcriptional regulator/tetratricopeptide (TPR) repeat protein